jgi:hypothetical protein
MDEDISWPEPKGGYKPISRIGTPLPDKEILAMGYEPTESGWKSFRHKPVPKPEPEQQELTPARRRPRKGRPGRPSRKA